MISVKSQKYLESAWERYYLATVGGCSYLDINFGGHRCLRGHWHLGQAFLLLPISCNNNHRTWALERLDIYCIYWSDEILKEICKDIPPWCLNSSHKKSNERHIVQSRKVLCHWKLLPAHRAGWSPILFLHFGLHRAHHSGSKCIIVHQWKSPVCEWCKVAVGST